MPGRTVDQLFTRRAPVGGAGGPVSYGPCTSPSQVTQRRTCGRRSPAAWRNGGSGAVRHAGGGVERRGRWPSRGPRRGTASGGQRKGARTRSVRSAASRRPATGRSVQREPSRHCDPGTPDGDFDVPRVHSLQVGRCRGGVGSGGCRARRPSGPAPCVSSAWSPPARRAARSGRVLRPPGNDPGSAPRVRAPAPGRGGARPAAGLG